MQHTVSTKTLVKASITATVVAAIALVTFILPAEYNIDPTGIGHKLGLTTLAQATESDVIVSTSEADTKIVGSQEFQTIEVVVNDRRDVEFKFAM